MAMMEKLSDRQLSSSFLVRCWVEPREAEDEPEVLRVYVRNLRTQEEHYINDPATVGAVLRRDLLQARENAPARPAAGRLTG